MARPRKYASDAERAAAYRQRQAEGTVRVDRVAVQELMDALDAAKAAGDPQAQMVWGGGVETTLRNLALFYRRRAQAAGRGER